MPKGKPDYLQQRIRKLREEKGWSQGELAAQMNLHGAGHITQRIQSSVETGERRVQAEEAKIYASVFSLSLEEFMKDPNA